MGPAGEPLGAVSREERGRLLALLAARFGALDLAEEVTAEALLAAVETWPRSGVPREPLAWLATTARRKALDRIRRDATLATTVATRRAAASRSPSTSTPPTTGCSSSSPAATRPSTWTSRRGSPCVMWRA